MDYEEDRLESINLYPSIISERLLINLGRSLYQALDDATRLDEVELLMEAIGEFSTMASFYGTKTDRIPESLGVDLNEAAIFKRDYLKRNEPVGDTYYQFSEQFMPLLEDTEAWLQENPISSEKTN